MFGAKHGSECCIDPSTYGLYQAFEKNLTATTADNPCEERGCTKHDSIERHGFGSASTTWDVYDVAKVEVAPAAEPCCQDNCQAAGRRICFGASTAAGSAPCIVACAAWTL